MPAHFKYVCSDFSDEENAEAEQAAEASSGAIHSTPNASVPPLDSAPLPTDTSHAGKEELSKEEMEAIESMGVNVEELQDIEPSEGKAEPDQQDDSLPERVPHINCYQLLLFASGPSYSFMYDVCLLAT